MSAPPPAFVAVDWNGTVVPFFGLDPYPDAVATLARLRAAGVPLVVVSRAHPRTIRDEVARLTLDADEVHGVLDKAPVLADLAAARGRGVFVGDTASDHAAARAAGVPFVQARLEGGPAFGDVPDFLRWADFDAALLAALAAVG